jgi:peroxiredoxin
MRTGSESSPHDSKLNSLKLSNWILAGAIAIGLISILFGFAQNRRVRLEKKQLQFQLQSLEHIAPCDSPHLGDVVPPIEAETTKGKRLTIDYAGTARYLLFFLSFKCNECVRQFPDWNEIARRAKSKNVVVLGLATDNERPPTDVADRDFDILTMHDAAALLRAYRINITPTVMLVSEHGRTQWVRAGALSETSTQELFSIINGETVIQY